MAFEGGDYERPRGDDASDPCEFRAILERMTASQIAELRNQLVSRGLLRTQ